MKNACKLLVLIFSFISISLCEDTLLHAIVITRHGDRTPTKLFPKTQSSWPEGLGQLTHIGMNQHYELGQRFRKIYIEDRKFINDTYRANEVHVRSSPKERTLMSAHSFMLGFYPPGSGPNSLPSRIQPVPIYSAEKTSDRILYAYKNCPRLKTLAKEVQATEEWKQMTNTHSGLLAKLSDIFGHKFSLKDVTTALNLIHGEEIHNRTRTPGITQDMIETMKHIAKWVFKRKFHTREMGKLGAGLLVHDIRTRFERSILAHKSGTSADHRFVLYSAHDGTLLALMSALGLTELEVPHYASHMVFELYHGGPDNYHVKIVYNGDEVDYPSCSLTDTKFCHFEQWSLLVEAGIPTQWDGECSGDQWVWRFDTEHFVSLFSGFFLGAITLGYFSKQHHSKVSKKSS